MEGSDYERSCSAHLTLALSLRCGCDRAGQGWRYRPKKWCSVQISCSSDRQGVRISIRVLSSPRSADFNHLEGKSDDDQKVFEDGKPVGQKLGERR
jgi:hypothetical protein